VAVAVVPPYLLRKRLRAENAGKVRVGMTQADVEELLGGPPGDYGMHGGLVATSASISDRSGAVRRTGRVWTGDDVSILVWFADGKVYEAPNHSPSPAGLTDRLGYPVSFWVWGIGKNNWGGPYPQEAGGEAASQAGPVQK
jgi:hypothetical protein